MGVVDKNYVQVRGWWYMSHEEIPRTVVLNNFPGGVGLAFQLPSMGRARIFTGTVLIQIINSFTSTLSYTYNYDNMTS